MNRELEKANQNYREVMSTLRNKEEDLEMKSRKI